MHSRVIGSLADNAPSDRSAFSRSAIPYSRDLQNERRHRDGDGGALRGHEHGCPQLFVAPQSVAYRCEGAACMA